MKLLYIIGPNDYAALSFEHEFQGQTIKKYGVENFTKEIIIDYPTRKEASDHEKRIVTKELIELDECCNLRTGGDNEYKFGIDKNVGINNPMFGKIHSENSQWINYKVIHEEHEIKINNFN